MAWLYLRKIKHVVLPEDTAVLFLTEPGHAEKENKTKGQKPFIIAIIVLNFFQHVYKINQYKIYLYEYNQHIKAKCIIKKYRVNQVCTSFTRAQKHNSVVIFCCLNGDFLFHSELDFEACVEQKVCGFIIWNRQTIYAH